MSTHWSNEAEEQLRRLLERARSLSVDELFEIAVHAAIYTSQGKLTPPYRSDDASDESNDEP